MVVTIGRIAEINGNTYVEEGPQDGFDYLSPHRRQLAEPGAFNTPRLPATGVLRGIVWDRLGALDRGWKATIVGVGLAAAVELTVRAGVL